MSQVFEWDGSKAERNAAKHRVRFEEAATIFTDPMSLTIDDPVHSQGERRFVTLGLSVKHRLLVVVHTDRADRVRIISARRATEAEKLAYETG
jgi:hypothetical protein